MGDLTSVESKIPVLAQVPGKVLTGAIGTWFTVVITTSGIYAWGEINEYMMFNKPKHILLPSGVTASMVAAGTNFVYVIDTNGVPYAFGTNSNGELHDGTNADRSQPVVSTVLRRGPVLFMSHTVDLVFQDKIILRRDTKPMIPTTSTFSQKMINIPEDTRVSQISTSSRSTMILTEDGQIYSVGGNYNGLLCNGDGSDQSSRVPQRAPTLINSNSALLGKNCTSIALQSSGYKSYIISSEKNLYGCGGVAKSVYDAHYTPTLLYQDVVAIDPETSIVLMSDGKLYFCDWSKSCSRATKASSVSRIFSFPNQLGMAALTENDELYLIAHSLPSTELLNNISYVPYVGPSGLLTTPFKSSEIARVTRWTYGEILLLLNNGSLFISGYSSWTPMYHNLNTILTTPDILVFKNDTMLVYWNGPDVRVIPMQVQEHMKKLKNVVKTAYGVTAVMLKCSDAYSGSLCDIPVCFGKPANDPNVCGGNGQCFSPHACSCRDLFSGDQCTQLSGFAYLLIIIGSVAMGLVVLVLLVFFIFMVTRYCVKVMRNVAKQRKAEIEMKSLLHQSLIKADQLLDLVDRDWVISLADLTFTERLSEGSFGVVFKGVYKNADV